MIMKIVPIHLREACEFIEKLHRHHKPPQGYKFGVGVKIGKDLVGVATVGRPVARNTDKNKDKPDDYPYIAEVTRLCTDGTKNACSMLYAACARTAKEMGYNEIQTFIKIEEPGISLRASGWEKMNDSPGKSHSVPSRPRNDKHILGPTVRWRKILNPIK